AVTFADQSAVNPSTGEQIILWEWDMNYDGVTFNKIPALDNQTNFDFNPGTAGTYQVALRVTTDLGACSSMIVKSVVVDPLPNAGITPDVTSGCSILTVNFSNDEVNNQPLPVDRYVWEVDEGAG